MTKKRRFHSLCDLQISDQISLICVDTLFPGSGGFNRLFPLCVFDFSRQM